jgi:hypothetical protein
VHQEVLSWIYGHCDDVVCDLVDQTRCEHDVANPYGNGWSGGLYWFKLASRIIETFTRWRELTNRYYEQNPSSKTVWNRSRILVIILVETRPISTLRIWVEFRMGSVYCLEIRFGRRLVIWTQSP